VLHVRGKRDAEQLTDHHLVIYNFFLEKLQWSPPGISKLWPPVGQILPAEPFHPGANTFCQ